jgi:hypothetical protein
MPRIRNEKGEVVWSVDARNYWTQDGPGLLGFSFGAVHQGTWDVQGGSVVVRDGYGYPVVARTLKPGETVEGID